MLVKNFENYLIGNINSDGPVNQSEALRFEIKNNMAVKNFENYLIGNINNDGIGNINNGGTSNLDFEIGKNSVHLLKNIEDLKKTDENNRFSENTIFKYLKFEIKNNALFATFKKNIEDSNYNTLKSSIFENENDNNKKNNPVSFDLNKDIFDKNMSFIKDVDLANYIISAKKNSIENFPILKDGDYFPIKKNTVFIKKFDSEKNEDILYDVYDVREQLNLKQEGSFVIKKNAVFIKDIHEGVNNNILYEKYDKRPFLNVKDGDTFPIKRNTVFIKDIDLDKKENIFYDTFDKSPPLKFNDGDTFPIKTNTLFIKDFKYSEIQNALDLDTIYRSTFDFSKIKNISVTINKNLILDNSIKEKLDKTEYNLNKFKNFPENDLLNLDIASHSVESNFIKEEYNLNNLKSLSFNDLLNPNNKLTDTLEVVDRMQHDLNNFEKINYNKLVSFFEKHFEKKQDHVDPSKISVNIVNNKFSIKLYDSVLSDFRALIENFMNAADPSDKISPVKGKNLYNLDTCRKCSIKVEYNKKATQGNNPMISNAERVAQLINSKALGGKVIFVSNGDSFGKREGQPGGIRRPIRNRF
jgi:hypothetical protein